MAWSARAAWFALRRHVDLVFCGHIHAAPLAAAIATFKRVPLWVQAHGIEAWQPHGRLVRRALETSALVTSVSRYTRTHLLEWADIPP